MLIPDAANTALMLIDMQNDFLHPAGAYGRAGKTSAAIAALPERLAALARQMREAGGWVVSTQFTLVPGKNNEPFISPHLKKLRPFLGKGDFAPGAFGHQLIDELQPADLSVEKITFSAFHCTRLDWLLRRAQISTLIFGGIVTNGGVASTLRDAHAHDYHCIILEDGCAAFSNQAHQSTINSLSTISQVAKCGDISEALRK